MTLKERLQRFNDEDIVEIGNVASNFRGSEAYELLSCVTEQQIMAELSDIGSKEGADKRLGRLEGIRMVMLALENYENFKEQVLARKEVEDVDKSPLEEPQVRIGGGGV